MLILGDIISFNCLGSFFIMTPDKLVDRGLEKSGFCFLTNTQDEPNNPTLLVAKRLKSQGVPIRISEAYHFGNVMESYVALSADSSLAIKLFAEITHSPEIDALEAVYDSSLELDVSKCNWSDETKREVVDWHREKREEGQRVSFAQSLPEDTELPPQVELEELVNEVVDKTIAKPQTAK